MKLFLFSFSSVILFTSMIICSPLTSNEHQRKRHRPDIAYVSPSKFTENVQTTNNTDMDIDIDFEPHYSLKKFEEAIFNHDIDYIQDFCEHGTPPSTVERILLISLMKSSTENSRSIFSLLVSKIESVETELKKHLFVYLKSCIGYDSQKFLFLWNSYSGVSALKYDQISDLIFIAISSGDTPIFNFIDSFLSSHLTLFESVFSSTFKKLPLHFPETDKINTMRLSTLVHTSTYRLKLKFLSNTHKIILLNIAAPTDDVSKVKFLCESEGVDFFDPDSFLLVRVPWDVAYAHGAKMLIQYYFTKVNSQIMLASALIYANDVLIKELISENMFTQAILHEYASKVTSIELLGRLLDLGLDFYYIHQGHSILSRAISTNNETILEFLIQIRKFDINTIFESYCSSQTYKNTFVAALFVNSEPMLRKLESYGANLDIECTIIDKYGKKYFSMTPLKNYYRKLSSHF